MALLIVNDMYIKNLASGQAWWRTALFSAQEAEEAELCEFKASRGYIVRPCLK